MYGPTDPGSVPRPPSGPVPSPLCVCPGCGVIAPTARTSCVLCEAPFPPAPLVAAGGVGEAVFARVNESDFECRGCGLRSPVSLAFHAEAECHRCGLVQAFAPGQWEEAIETAHGVADLSGPDPEGRFRGVGPSIAAKNPRKSLGLEHTRTEHTQSTTIFEGGTMKRLTLRVSVSPGHPVCAACHVPLGVAIDGRGNAETRCPRCGDRAAYALPAGAAEKAPMLRAAIGPDQRTDRPAAKIARGDAAGVAAIQCPSCGAALAVTPGAELATCQFCRTTSRVARRAFARASGAAPPFEPFWVLLQGPSKQRGELVAEAAAGRREEAHVVTRKKVDDIVAAQRKGTVILYVVIALFTAGVTLWAVLRATPPPPAHRHRRTRPRARSRR